MTTLEAGDGVRVILPASDFTGAIGVVEAVGAESGAVIVRLAGAGVALAFGETELTRFRSIHDWLHDCEPCKAKLAARIAAGLCAIVPVDDTTTPWMRRCITHDCPDSMAHHFEIHPDAFND